MLCFNAGWCSHIHLEKDAVNFFRRHKFRSSEKCQHGVRKRSNKIKDIMKSEDEMGSTWAPALSGGKAVNIVNAVTSIIYCILIKPQCWASPTWPAQLFPGSSVGDHLLWSSTLAWITNNQSPVCEWRHAVEHSSQVRSHHVCRWKPQWSTVLELPLWATFSLHDSLGAHLKYHRKLSWSSHKHSYHLLHWIMTSVLTYSKCLRCFH